MQSRYPDCTAPSPPQSVSSDCDALSNCQSAPPNDNALPSHGSALPCLSTTSDHIKFPPCEIASSDGDGSIKQSALPEKYAPFYSHSSSKHSVLPPCKSASFDGDASPNQSILSVKCVLPPCQLALSPQPATPNSSPNDSILQPQLDPLNDSFPYVVESKSLSHITPHLTTPKRLSPQCLFCNCKARCGSKRCPCRKNQSLCCESCHPGKKCVNNVSEGEHM